MKGLIFKIHMLITNQANKFLLKKRNSDVREDLARVVMDIESSTQCKVLKGTKNKLRRVRWNDYRIIYKIWNDEIIILMIGLRKNCYKKLNNNLNNFLRPDYSCYQPFEFNLYCN